MRAWATAGLLAIGGCFSDNGGGATNPSAGTTGVASTTDGPTTGTTGAAGTSSTGVAPTDTGEATTESTTGTSETATTGMTTPDLPGDGPCDPYAQDCPEGYKCAPYASDGGPAWDANKCVMVTGDDTPGGGCTAEVSGTSGRDSCIEGALCTNVDPNLLTGVCVALCGGSEANPTCNPGTGCLATNEGVINLCVQRCDPLAMNACDLVGQACIDNEGDFLCVESGGYEIGEFCEFLNDCAEGSFCGPSIADSCKAPGGCCLAYCDTAEGDGCDAPDECVAYDPPSPMYPQLGYCASD
jgi:hypothetical protein